MAGVYKIYGLLDPFTQSIRYIGYTSKELDVRLKYHYYDVTRGVKSHKTNWFNSVIQKGGFPCIVLIDSCCTLNEALKLEVFYISKYTNLTNSTNGGECNKVYKEDVLLKMSINRKGKCVGENNPMFGKSRPDVSTRNKNPNRESVKKMAETLKSKYNTNEYKKILRESQLSCKELEVYKDGVLIKTYRSKREAAEELKLDRKSINSVLKGMYQQHKGYYFKEVV